MFRFFWSPSHRKAWRVFQLLPWWNIDETLIRRLLPFISIVGWKCLWKWCLNQALYVSHCLVIAVTSCCEYGCYLEAMTLVFEYLVKSRNVRFKSCKIVAAYFKNAYMYVALRRVEFVAFDLCYVIDDLSNLCLLSIISNFYVDMSTNHLL